MQLEMSADEGCFGQCSFELQRPTRQVPDFYLVWDFWKDACPKTLLSFLFTDQVLLPKVCTENCRVISVYWKLSCFSFDFRTKIFMPRRSLLIWPLQNDPRWQVKFPAWKLASLSLRCFFSGFNAQSSDRVVSFFWLMSWEIFCMQNMSCLITWGFPNAAKTFPWGSESHSSR